MPYKRKFELAQATLNNIEDFLEYRWRGCKDPKEVRDLVLAYLSGYTEDLYNETVGQATCHATEVPTEGGQG